MASSLYNKISRIQQMKNSYIKADNLRQGVNVFGVNGTYTSDANAIGNDLASGKTAYVNGTRISGSLTVYNNLTRNIPWGSINDDYANQCLRINYSNTVNTNTRPNYHTNCGNAAIYNGAYLEIGYSNLAKEIGLDPLTLKKDVSVIGVVGQYDASTEFSGIKMDPIIASDSAISLTSSITEVSGLDMTQGTNLAYYFNSLYGLTTLSNLSAPNVTNLYHFCNGDYRLQKIEHANFYSEEQTPVNCGYMFNNCSNLKEIPNSVIFPKTINNTWYMFENCRQLSSINTPLNISTNNLSRLFMNCQSLVSISDINIPTTVKCNTGSMFSNCFQLDVANINLKGAFTTNNAGSMLANTNYSTRANLQKFFANMTSAYINGGMLSYSNIESVDCNLWSEIPQLLHNYNLSSSFSYCRNLKTVNLYKTNYSTLASTFYYCSNLTDVDITSPNITFTGLSNTFWGCANLINVNLDINMKLTSMLNSFSQCYNLNNITFNNSFSQTTRVNLYQAFNYCHNLPNFKANITAGPSHLGYAFYNCYSLKEVTFNAINNWFDGINSVAFAFYNCSNLQSIDNKRDIKLSFTVATSGVFHNCSNLNINSIDYDINSTGTIGNVSQIISNNPFITTMNINIQGYLENSYYGINMNNIVSNCSNMQNVDINLIDRSTNTNTWYVGEVLRGCRNLKNVNFSIYTNSNRGMYGAYVTYCDIDNLNISASRALDKTNHTNISVSYSNIINFKAHIDASYGSIHLTDCGINNFNLTTNNLITFNQISFTRVNFFKDTFVMNYSNLEKIGNISYTNINNVKNLKMNFSNSIGINNTLSYFIQNCNDLESIEMDLSNISNTHYITICNMPNLKNVTYNLTNLKNTGYTFNLYNIGSNCTDITMDMANLQVTNYIFEVTYCYGLVNLNLNIGKKLTNIYNWRFANLPNLSNIYLDWTNIGNVYISYNLNFFNCKNLSDTTIDNIMGMVANASYYHSSYKKINGRLFNNCDFSVERLQNLANYNNLISAGWTY